MLSLRNWKYFLQNVDISSPNISSNRHVPRQGKNRWKYINNTLSIKSLAPWRCVSKCEKFIFYLITPIGNFEQFLWMCFQESRLRLLRRSIPGTPFLWQAMWQQVLGIKFSMHVNGNLPGPDALCNSWKARLHTFSAYIHRIHCIPSLIQALKTSY